MPCSSSVSVRDLEHYTCVLLLPLQTRKRVVHVEHARRHGCSVQEILLGVSPTPGRKSHPGCVDIAGSNGVSPPRHCRARKTAQTRSELSPPTFRGITGWREFPPIVCVRTRSLRCDARGNRCGTREYFSKTYIWKDDPVGQEFQEHLARKAEEGVAVYVIFDSFGNLVVPRSFKSSFHPSIHVLEYRAIRRPWHILDPRRYALDHRKLLIVDGTTSFIGGYNLGALYATEWRDTHLSLRGQGATELARAFIGFWNRFCPALEQITHRYHHPFDALITISQNEAMRASFPIRDMYIAAIDEAEQSILLTTAYFVPDHMLLDALKAAVRRGVDVRVLVPWESNHVVTDWIAHSYFTDCLQGGIRIFGYRYTMLHAKTCTIDGEWSTVGTCNLDRLSLVGNYEINVAIYSTAFAQQMSALFAEDTAERFELTMQQWRN